MKNYFEKFLPSKELRVKEEGKEKLLENSVEKGALYLKNKKEELKKELESLPFLEKIKTKQVLGIGMALAGTLMEILAGEALIQGPLNIMIKSGEWGPYLKDVATVDLLWGLCGAGLAIAGGKLLAEGIIEKEKIGIFKEKIEK